MIILSEPSERRMCEGKEVDEKERMHMWEAFSHMFSQWDVETDVCMLMHCVCIVRLRR